MIENLDKYNGHRFVTDAARICYAPSVSMNFEAGGHATPCCYNRSYVIGRWPDSSVEELWNSPENRAFQEILGQNDLSWGCDLCSLLIESGNFASVLARYYDEYGDWQISPVSPRQFTFELGNTCNLMCVMCKGFWSAKIRSQREHLPPVISPYDSVFVEQISAYFPVLKDLKFLGGEPFLIDIYYEIWEKIGQINPGILAHITTNGTILNHRVKKALSQLSAGIVVSLDALTKKIYEDIRIGADFDAVMKNIDYFRSYTQSNHTYLSIAVCPLKNNWRQLPLLLDYCNAKDLPIHFNSVVFPEYSLRSMAKADLQEVISYLTAYPARIESRLAAGNTFNYRCMIAELVYWHQLSAGADQLIDRKIVDYYKDQKLLKGV